MTPEQGLDEKGVTSPDRQTFRVWDLPVRLFHWLLVASVTGAAVSGFFLLPRGLFLHLLAGSIMAALVVFRLIWGFTGSTFSRFSSFLYTPRQTLAHLRGLGTRHVPAELGHNPAGALMVFGFLAVLTAMVITGTVALGGIDKQGPLAFAVPYATGRLVRQLHELMAYLIVVMVIAHLGGVVFESWRGRLNLARSMVTGIKQVSPPIHQPPPAKARVLSTVLAIVVFGGLAVTTVMKLAALPAAGVPVAAMPKAYKDDCGECHTAFHPSLLPAATWTAILSSLNNHFGEDASLTAKDAREIEAYIADNSAEHYDTLPSRAFLKPGTPDARRITDTARWKHIHQDLPPELFKSRAVASKVNCSACHMDAEQGLFAPQKINPPAMDQPATKS